MDPTADDLCEGFHAEFSSTITFTNNSENSFSDIELVLFEIPEGIILANADTPGGEGALLTVPETGQYSDGILGSNEAVDIDFVLCLPTLNRFIMYVDFYGIVSDTARQFTLTLNKSGTGAGAVTSSPVGIDCGDDCTEDYDENITVTLTALPDSGSVFTGWSGDCSGTISLLELTIDSVKTCNATFDLEPPPDPTIMPTGPTEIPSDTIPPSIDITSPVGQEIKDTTPEIIVEYSDDGSGLDLPKLNILLDGNLITSACTVGSISTSCELPALTDGEHTIDADITDIAGNFAMDSHTFIVDTSIIGSDGSATKTIGVDGGFIKVTIGDGSVLTLEIPPGALLEDTEIKLTPIERTNQFPDPGDGIVGGLFGVDFGPDGLEFNIPASLKAVYPDSVVRNLAMDLGVTEAVAEGKIIIQSLGPHPDFTNDIYQPLRLIDRDVENNTMIVELEHFSSAWGNTAQKMEIIGVEIVNPLNMGQTSTIKVHYDGGSVVPSEPESITYRLNSPVLNISNQSFMVGRGSGEGSSEFTARPATQGYGEITVLSGFSLKYRQTILVDVPHEMDIETVNLLRKHAPILRFNEDENFFPISVDTSLAQSDVFLDTGKSVEKITLNNLGIRAGSEFKINLPDIEDTNNMDNTIISSLNAASKTVYATAVECKSRPERLALQYWFHYFYDDKETAGPNLFAHEGDWEMVTVFLNKNNKAPIGVTISQHEFGRKLIWNHVQKEDDNPVIYVGKGSHANFSRAGDFEVCNIPLIDCVPNSFSIDSALGNGLIIRPSDTNYQLINLPRLTSVTSSSPESWLLFSGKWGVKKSLLNFGNPPDTPTFNGLSDVPKWYDPCAWSETIPANVYVGGRTNGNITKFNSISGKVLDGDGNPLTSNPIVTGLTNLTGRFAGCSSLNIYDIEIDPQGIIYGGRSTFGSPRRCPSDGAVRANADTGVILSEINASREIVPVRFWFEDPDGPSIDNTGNIYFNTSSCLEFSFLVSCGGWKLPKESDSVEFLFYSWTDRNPLDRFGTPFDESENTRLISRGRGTTFASTGPFAGNLLIAVEKFNTFLYEGIMRVDVNSASFGNPVDPIGIIDRSEVDGDIFDVVQDSLGNIYVSSLNPGKIIKYDPNGQNPVDFMVFPMGKGPKYMAFDLDDNLYFTTGATGLNVNLYKLNREGEIVYSIFSTENANGIAVE